MNGKGERMARIGVLGLGLMGSAIAEAFLVAGHSVIVWNRTASKAERLVELGASAAGTPTEVLAESELTVIVLSDYRSVRDVLDEINGDSRRPAAATVLNLTTGDAPAAIELRSHLAPTGIMYLDGAILAYPRAIGADADVVIAGPETVWDAHRPVLMSLGSGTAFVGEQIEHANVIDTSITGSFFCVAMGAFYEATAYAARSGMTADKLVPYALRWTDQLRTEIENGAREIVSGDYTTDQAAVVTYEKAIAMITESIQHSGQPAHLNAALLENLRAAMAAGHGRDSLAAIHATLTKDVGA
ncbi:NAD(P)-dependent oxidoreductase [Rhodococcus jostii]|uniref:NAD(P)-dependent oxidoreductase n=1 Tax=Rhodococcus jostii TaxID=132919 RepID=UPI003637216A